MFDVVAVGDELFAQTHRVLEHPVDVIVRVDRVFLPRPSTYHNVALSTKAFGIDLGTPVPGWLLGWYQLEVGGWWGLVEFTVGSRNGRLQLSLRQLVPAAALSPQDR